MIRQFVNIVAEIGSTGSYSLSRLDVSKHLFYPSRAAAEAANNKNGRITSLPWLPAPIMRFEPSPTTLWETARLEVFALLSPRSGDDKIFCSNTAGHTVVYNADSGSLQVMPPLNGDKGFMPMAISIAPPGAPEEDLYVMSTGANLGGSLSCFDVLRFGSSGYHDSEEERPMCRRGWHWDPLPPLPIAAYIRSHTVVDGGSTICVSAAPRRGGTYCFDTVKREWRQATGDWVLPFLGKGEYVPELKLWMGFSTDNQQLCAWDLSAMDEPPSLLHAWTDLETPDEWHATRLNLLNLGSGRFCIAKVFRVAHNTDDLDDLGPLIEKFAVLTGVEMVKHPEEGLRMVKHKSIRYMFTDEKIRWVL